MGLRIIEAGFGSTIQDGGRVGAASLGVPRCGPVDARSHALANRLAGNDPDAAALETAGGLVVEALKPAVVATSGDGQRHTLAEGDRLVVDTPPEIQWVYLAVRGGVAVSSVLGSRSHDTLSGLGPEPLRPGVTLPIGPDPGRAMPTDLAPPRPPTDRPRLWAAPRHPMALGVLLEREWVVKDEVSRVGVRLRAGAAFDRSAAAGRAHRLSHDLAGQNVGSEGLVLGAVQLTPSGEPIVMLANHPTTGGYPVIAVVDPDDVGAVAQARPGTRLHFRPA